MEKIMKRYVFRLYPNEKQKELIEKSFGTGKKEYRRSLQIKENDIIVTEKLQINKMVQNKNLSKKIYDCSWYELIRQLEYKSKWKK